MVRFGSCVVACLSIVAITGGAFVPAAHAGNSKANFNSCPGNESPSAVPVAPHTTAPMRKRTGSLTRVAVSQVHSGRYQQINVRVGNQEIPSLLDTGSSWMVINQSAVVNNPKIVPTGQRAAVSYSGGAVCISGPVMRGPVSIGGLRPRTVTFLMATGGSFPFTAIFGINTWNPPSTRVDITMRALAISQFELTMTQRTFDQSARGTFVVNGSPTIRRANKNKVLTYRNRALAGGDRIYIPGRLSAGANRKAAGSFMLDIGTPYNFVSLFPAAARKLGFNYASNTWTNPDAPLGLWSYPARGGSVRMPVDGPTTLIGTDTQAIQRPWLPQNGLIGLAGTTAVLGADYVRPFVLGVQYTQCGSVVKLLRRRP